ncbi:hypothetical protein GCM10010345_88960 [Streptomyces canarius]|uniref:Aminoglycoside phosphotransferase domain-containing protein n=1 Tax=Streptomyces canarius TaxID=285453 RepID=A0ABQ3DBV7_9ACTN|nr:hypothetical protein GCM10010345_88960 [Streptomyces canarius]
MCHNDPAPKNTVYQLRVGEPRPAMFMDWDRAAPGARVVGSRRTAPVPATRAHTAAG